MRDTAREIFTTALKNASIENAFARSVHCERRVLRIGDDLYDLDSYNRVFVVSIGKAAHTMASALEAQLAAASKASWHRRSDPLARCQPVKSRFPLFSRWTSHAHRRIHPRRRRHPQTR